MERHDYDVVVIGLMVRVRTVRSGAHDREVHLGVPVSAQEAGEIGGNLALGAAREAHAGDVFEARVGLGARGR